MDILQSQSLYGVPVVAVVMAVVAALERAGLPSRYAGLTAIGIAFLIGLAVLSTTSTMAPLSIIGMAFLWGLSAPVVQTAIVSPFIRGKETPSGNASKPSGHP